MRSSFGLSSVLIRFVVALLLVLSTYNPSGYSYYDWIYSKLALGNSVSLPLLLLVGVAILIGWVIFWRATLRSLGPIGVLLTVALLACLIWLAVDLNLLKLTGKPFIYIVLILLAAIMAIGLSWSHIRRRLSGQMDMDDVDQ
ncbi:MAG: DUF6524 family protein [Pseudomonadota bacterium]